MTSLLSIDGVPFIGEIILGEAVSGRLFVVGEIILGEGVRGGSLFKMHRVL